MNWQWILLFLTCHTFINSVENKEIVAQINTKRLLHYVPDRFLSMTIDPTSLFLAGNLEQRALKMARGLYPSFVRLGGKATNYLKFGKELFVDNNTITEDQWDGVNSFVGDAGLDLIVSLNPTHRVQGVWDSRDALQLISYSDKHGYNVAWQLGYDTQGHLETGSEVGRDIIRLRNILDGFQRYATAPVFGPDLPDVYTLKESAFIKDILVHAGPVLGAILVQMPFNNENPDQKIANILFNMESHIWSREIRYGRMIPKKPIWIAEKNPSRGTVEDAITLVKYLGTAAQIGCQMVFRQVGPESLKNPTPDYWLALLYKNLVGRGVFDAKVATGNKSEIVLFSHCSQTISPERSILDTGFNYDKGSVTVFGVNESPEAIKLTLKASMKDEKAHIYFLTFEEDPNGKTEKTFLNGQLLTSSPSGDLPIISPKIKRTIKYGINVPSRSIFFIVLPDLKSRTCMFPSSYLSPDVQSLSKKLIHVVADVLEKPSNDLKSEEEDPQNVYVKFAKSSGIQNSSTSDNKPGQVAEDSEPDVQVRYITFNDNSWLSKLTETMANPKVFEQPDDNSSSGNNENKYTSLAAAITGSDNLSEIPSTDATPSIALLGSEASNPPERKKRSVSEQSTIDDALSANEKQSIASQEDLVKHLNNYASTVYRKSPKENSNKEIKITNIPPEIFNTLKNVKVTFKNMGNEQSAKDEADNTNEPLIEKSDDSKDAAPLNSFLLNNDESLDRILDSEKSIINPAIASDKELYNYKVETLRNKSPTDTIQKYIKRFGENRYQESNDPIKKKIDPLIISQPFQDKAIYQGRISKQHDVNQHSIEINDRTQEELDEKNTDQENIPSDIEASNQEISEGMDEMQLAKSKSDEYQFSQKTESGTKESQPNYILTNVPVISDNNMDDVEEAEKNIILVPMNSVESADIPNLSDEEDAGNEQIKDYDEKKLENNQDISEINDEDNIAKLDNKQDDEYLNDEEVKASPKTEKESFQSVNGIISDKFDDINGSEKNNNNEDYIDGDELLLTKSKATLSDDKPLLYIPNQSSSEESKSSSLIVPMTNENQGLNDGPPIPSYNQGTVKVVQREIPMNEEMPESMPIVMVPISMGPQEQVHDDNEQETKSLKMSMDEGDVQDNINQENANKNIMDFSMSNKDGKYISKEDLKIRSSQAPENTGKPFSETKVVSFADVPLENIVDRSYGRAPYIINYQQNLLPSLENQITLDNLKKDIEELETITNESNEKRAIPKTDETYSTKEVTMPVLLMSPQSELQPLPDMEVTEEPQIDILPLKMSQVTDDKADYSPSNENSQSNGEKEDGNDSRYKLLEKLVTSQEVSTSKPDEDDATEKSKTDLEKEKKERLQSLKKQIAEIREHFRAQVKEEGLKAALQRREEEMRNYLTQEKEFKKKLFAYPLISHDHSILSRPRRLSYFPQSDFSDEEDCDYLDDKIYKRRTDSYGVPILGDYEKSYLTPQVISAPPRNPENNRIFFPLDPKTPQALVYDDKIIPAKFYGVLSMNEEPSIAKANNIANRQILDFPIENGCQKCLLKQYDSHPIVKDSYGPKILDDSLEGFSLPKDTYIKSNNQPNYIPIVVLSASAKNHRRRRSIDEDNLPSTKLIKRDTKQQTDLKKRSIEQIPPFEGNVYLDRSYDYLNEIAMEGDNRLNGIDYTHSNDIIPKSHDINPNKFSPEFLPSNNQPVDYIQSRQQIFHAPPIWNDAKVTNEMEQRHFLPPHQSPIGHPSVPEEQSQEKDSPKTFIWSLMHDKFKSMLEMLQSLAEWCYSSSKK